MENNNFILIGIQNQLKRIADALEESNEMIKDFKKWYLEKEDMK